MNTKTCKNCNETKTLDCFTIHHTDHKGRTYYQSDCKDCTKQYLKTYYATKRDRLLNEMARYRSQNKEVIGKRVRERIRVNTELVDNIKSTTPCADCGLIALPFCMEFDHIKGSKKSNNF